MELKITVTGGDASHASRIITEVSKTIDEIEIGDPNVSLKMCFSFEENKPVMRYEESTPFSRYISSSTVSGEK